MAAPTPVSVTQTHFPGLTANPVIDLDDATVAGDRTVVFAFLGRSRPLGVTWPSPWAEPVDINNTAGNTMITTVGWVDHAAPETSVQLTTTSTHAVWAQAFRFAAGTFDPASPPVFATAINSGDPPSLNPPWGVEEWLAFASLTRDGALGTVAFPLPNNQLSTNGGIFGSAAICTGPINADSVDPAQWVSTGVGAVVTAGLRGPVAADPTEAVMAFVLPALTASLTAAGEAEGVLGLVLPPMGAGFTGEAHTAAVLAGQLPPVGFAGTAEAAADGVLGATLPGLQLAATAEAAADGTLTAALPALTFTATGEASAEGQLAGVLPQLQLALEGVAVEGGAALLDLVLPALTAQIEARATAEATLAGTLPALRFTATGGGEVSTLCGPWPLPPTGLGCPELDVEYADFAVMAASEILHALSGQQFGTCPVLIRPCRQACAPEWAGAGWPGWWPAEGPYPRFPGPGGAIWWGAMCGQCVTGCSCNSAATLVLPESVVEVQQVLVDGVELTTPANWVIYDGRTLVRTDGEQWPMCQDWTVTPSGVGAWSVTATFGEPVPMIGSLALAWLAKEIQAGCTTGKCRLPAWTTEVSRQGVTQKRPSWKEIAAAGVVGVGLPQVDTFLRTVNPSGLTARPRIWNPDTFAKQPRRPGYG